MTPQSLAALHAAAFTTSRAWSAAEFSQLLSQKGIYLCGDNRSFAMIRVTIDEAELLTLATAPQHRRQGLARITLAATEQAAYKTGATTLFLEVAENNTAARMLYENADYVQIGRRPKYYVPKDSAPIAALVLRKSLP